MSPSIPPLVHQVTDDEVKGKARELFEGIKASTGEVPKWMRVMANQEDVLIGFFTMFKAIMDDAPVDKKLKWRMALKVSDINKCEYCVSIAKAQLKNFGLSPEQIEDIENQPLTEAEQVAMEYAVATTKQAYNLDPKLIEKVKKHYTDEQLVELTSVVGLFSFINRFNDSLRILPDVG